MFKIGIITINDNNNYGNRLQNYAVQEILKKMGGNPETIKNNVRLNNKVNMCVFIRKYISFVQKNIKEKITGNRERRKFFGKFNSYINFSKKLATAYTITDKDYDFFLVGSDQVWKPTYGRLSDMDLLEFTTSNKKIAFSASFGINELPEKYRKKAAKALKDFKVISVREDAGKKIVEDLTGRKDVQVLIDPTVVLTASEWDKVLKKPEQLKCDRYILNYFLGELSAERKKEIDRIAKENNCEVINILDKNSPFYQTGPSEFLYLEKNAFLICTDSFHSSVFAILYNRPFIVFEREQKGLENMNSRIETLINKFKLKNRKFTGKITEENLKHDYTEAYKILEIERQKSNEFLRKALDISE